MIKKNSEKYRESLKESDESRALLRKTLEKINLSNADLWENQYMMLADEEELLKTKNRMESRYEKLKEQIKYNLERIDKSKKYILEFVKKHPDKSDVIMEWWIPTNYKAFIIIFRLIFCLQKLLYALVCIYNKR